MVAETANNIQREKYEEELSAVGNSIRPITRWEAHPEQVIAMVAALILFLLALCFLVYRLFRCKKEICHESENGNNLIMEKLKKAAKDGDWDQFSMLYGEMQPDFIRSLYEKHPKLTSGEVRLACLIRLGVESKDIARLMSINPDSVKKNRQRLRAKLGLTPDASIDAYLHSF